MKIYIVLTQSTTMLAKIIRKGTKFPYNHVSIALDKELYHMYSFGRRKPKNPLIAGFIREDLDNGFYAVFKDIPCLIYEYKVSYESYRKICKIISHFYKKKLEYKFNITGLFLNPVGIDYTTDNSFFCAEFLAHLLKESGCYDFNMPNTRITPEHFYEFEGAKLIYDGYIQDYKETTRLK